MFTHSVITARRLVVLASIAAAVAVPATAAAECCPVDGGTPSVLPAGQPGAPDTPPPSPTSFPPSGGDTGSVIPAGQPGAPDAPPGQPGTGDMTPPPLPPGIDAVGGGSVIPAGQPGGASGTSHEGHSVIGAGQPQSGRVAGGKFPRPRMKFAGHKKGHRKHRAHRISPRTRFG